MPESQERQAYREDPNHPTKADMARNLAYKIAGAIEQKLSEAAPKEGLERAISGVTIQKRSFMKHDTRPEKPLYQRVEDGRTVSVQAEDYLTIEYRLIAEPCPETNPIPRDRILMIVTYDVIDYVVPTMRHAESGREVAEDEYTQYEDIDIVRGNCAPEIYDLANKVKEEFLKQEERRAQKAQNPENPS